MALTEIATVSLLPKQPLLIWTGDAQQTPGGIARTAPNARRPRQQLLAKCHGLRDNRKYYMPSHLATAMIRLLGDTAYRQCRAQSGQGDPREGGEYPPDLQGNLNLLTMLR